MNRVLLPFEFLEPATVDEVADLVDGGKTRVLAGGVDLVLKMRLRQVLPERVVSLRRVPGLDGVESNGSGLRFGALATLRRIERSQAVREHWPLLSEAIGTIVSVQTKAMGTAVGNLCVGTPASDVAVALYALGAGVVIEGVHGTREVPIEEFFVDVGRTALAPHEIVTEIRVPRSLPGSTGAFIKMSKTAEDIAKVNAAVAVSVTAGNCESVRIALGSVAPTPIRAPLAEELLLGSPMTEELIGKAADAAADSAAPVSDVRSTSQYRKEMVKVLVKDCLNRAIERAPVQGG